MSAYLVFIRQSTRNVMELERYEKEVQPLLGLFGFTPLAVYGAHEVFEGSPIEGIVIVEFPTSSDAKGWYDNPDYRQIREHRLKGAEYQCIFVEGV
jgi:uncharacterized protein (DUF1330 family)